MWSCPMCDVTYYVPSKFMRRHGTIASREMMRMGQEAHAKEHMKEFAAEMESL